MIEYNIYKMSTPKEFWDGPFKTLKAAWKEFEEKYANEPGQPQDFAIFKTITTRVSNKWVRRKSGPRRASKSR
jgi:hypothetical protein